MVWSELLEIAEFRARIRCEPRDPDRHENRSRAEGGRLPRRAGRGAGAWEAEVVFDV